MNDKPIDQHTDSELLQEWKLWKDRTTFATTKERALRAYIISKHFPTPKEGANNTSLDLGDNRTVKLKLTYPIDRKVDEPVLDALIKAARTPVCSPTDTPHPLAAVNFDKIIRRKPELATKEYRALSEEQRCLLDTCLTIKPGSAQLTMEVLEP